MASRQAWCEDKTEKLLREDSRMTALSEIKDHFAVISQDEAQNIANTLQLPVVFDCLNDTKTEQVDLAVDVLTLCMNSMSLGETTGRYGSLLERALHHPSPNVKLMALNEIHRTVSNSESIFELSQQVPIVVALITCLGDNDLSIAKKSGDILTMIGKSREGLRQLLLPEIRKAFADTILISDIVRFRIYEIIVNISSHAEENLQSILTTGLITSLLAELDSSDILLRLNVIELLSTLAGSPHGLEYLQGKGIIDKLHHQLASVNEDPLGNLVVPGLLRFFGNLAFQKPKEIHNQYPVVFTMVFDIIKSNDFSILGTGLDTLGHIARTNDGKQTLATLNKEMFEAMRFIGDNLTILPTGLRVRALYCIESVIRIQLHEQTEQLESLVSLWFRKVSDDPLSIVLKYAEIPFVDLRVAALNILQAMAELQWGQDMINAYPGLIEFLLDRRVENSKESKEIKYEIIKALSTSTVFSADVRKRLNEFVRQGPFYVQPITQVMIEGSS